MNNVSRQTFRFFLRHIWNAKGIYAVMVISMIIGVSVEVLVPIYYKEIFDLFVDAEGIDRAAIANRMIEILMIVIGLMTVMYTSWRVNEFCSNAFTSRAMMNIGNECFENLNRHSYRFYSDHFAGSLVRKVGRLIWAFNKFMNKVYWDFTPLTVRLIAILGVLFYYNALLAWVLLGWLVIFVAGTLAFSLYKYPYEAKIARRDSQISGYLADVITNSINVKLFTAQQAEARAFAKINSSWRKERKYAWDLGSYFNAAQGFFMIALEILVMYLMIRLWEQSLVTVGFLFLVQGYVIGLFSRLWDLKWMIQEIFDAFSDSEEMTRILNTPFEVVDKPQARQLMVEKAKIEFNGVQFGYHADQPILKDFNLAIQPGEKIALVGHSGEGKSTITKLLMRFFDLQKGEILFDGQNIADVSLKSLRENISLVPQDPMLFHRSLLDNIRYGRPNATKQEVLKASKLANCHEFIDKLKEGYKTFVGERGIKLSGGERQRVAIARAILEDAPMVILDEATSSLDSHSEKLIQQALHRLLKGKTAIIIAHRLSTIMECDRILVIEKGRIVEQGTHAALLRRPKGIYKRLWKIQAGGFLMEDAA